MITYTDIRIFVLFFKDFSTFKSTDANIFFFFMKKFALTDSVTDYTIKPCQTECT